MKCSDLSKGSFAAIELILRDVFTNSTDVPLEKCVEMIEDQCAMIRQLQNLPKREKIEIKD